MKRFTVKSPGQLYLELTNHLAASREVPLALNFDDTLIGMDTALAYHDILSIFSAKLDMTVEVFYDAPMSFLAAICALPTENRLTLPSVSFTFHRDTVYSLGTVSHNLITGEQYLNVENKIASLISGGSNMSIDEVKHLRDIGGFLTNEKALEQRVVGGHF